METDERQRILQLVGARNLRDVGGYLTTDGLRQTRWRMLYRSGSLHELHEVSQQWLINAGLRSIIDLRDPDEVAERPSLFAGSPHLRYLQLHFYDGPRPDSFAPDLHLGYRRELDELGERLVRYRLLGSDC